jgi:hypothetical protein
LHSSPARVRISRWPQRGDINGSVGAVWFIDGRTQLLAVHANDDGLGGLLGCQSLTEFSTIGFNAVDAGKINPQLWVSDNLFVNVYDFTGFPAFDCDLLNNVTGRLVASGRIRFMWKPNDAGVTPPNASTAGWTGHGIVDVVGGGTTQYRLNARILLTPTGVFSVRAIDIVLNPDPR